MEIKEQIQQKMNTAQWELRASADLLLHYAVMP